MAVTQRTPNWNRFIQPAVKIGCAEITVGISNRGQAGVIDAKDIKQFFIPTQRINIKKLST